MTPCKALHALLAGEILKEFESVSVQIDAFAEQNELSEAQHEEREAITQLHHHFNEVLQAIELRRIDEEHCEKILEELHGMREMGEHLGL